MLLGQQLKRIRRYLRDPNAKIWSDELIINVFNDCQRALQQRTMALTEVRNIQVPPVAPYSYTHEWEWGMMNSGMSNSYKAFSDSPNYGMVTQFRWESQQLWDTDSVDASADGDAYCHEWEAFIDGVSPGYPVKFRLHDDFYSISYIAYDRFPLEKISKKALMDRDSVWPTYSGRVYYYYTENDPEPVLILYPRPSSVTFTDSLTSNVNPADILYIQDWEDDYVTNGGQWGYADADNERTNTFGWESDLGSKNEPYMRGMWPFEVESGGGAILLFIDGDTYIGTAGQPLRRDYTYSNADSGAVIETIEDSNNITLVFVIKPRDVDDVSDESAFPEYLQKYIEYDVISRLYGANTDGRIKTLAEYWRYRAEIGVKMIRDYLLIRAQDRDYQMCPATGIKRQNRHPRLPSTYPLTYP
jgi:hypothetical protein